MTRSCVWHDGVDRGAEKDPVAELGGHALGQLLGAPGEARFLRSAGGPGEVGQPAACVEIEEGEQQRQLARFGAEDRLDGDIQ